MEGEGPSEEDPNVSAAANETQDMETEDPERNIQQKEENEGQQEAAGEINLAGTSLVEAAPHDDDCFIVDVQDANTANNNDSPGEVVWRVRVCPILLADFCHLKKGFTSMIKLTVFFEYRMSQHLCTRPDPGVHTPLTELQDQDLPMLPNENIFIKPINAATAGLLEMKVLDSNLLDLVTFIRTMDLSRKSRLRFELKRLPVEDAQQKEKKVEGKPEGAAKTEEQAKTESKEKTEGEMEMAEEKTEKEDTDLAALKTPDLLVNFAIRLQPVNAPAFRHPEGYKLQAEDKQIYVSKVPAEVPDHVMQAVLCSQLLVRQVAEDGTSTAVFQVDSPLGAQGYMELFDGILINSKELEMSTTLGTLIDAKKKHHEKILQQTAKNKQTKAVKRKHDSSEVGPQHAKKPRDDLDFISRLYLEKKQTQKMQGALSLGVPPGSAPQQPPWQGRGASQSRRAGGRLRSRGGFPGRGGPRGRGTGGGRGVPQRGAGRGVFQRGAGRGVLQRGAGRGVLQRGAGRGVLQRGAGRGVLQKGAGRGVLQRGTGKGVLQRGAGRGVLQRGPRRGAPSRGGQGMRSRVRGAMGRGILGMPGRESISPRAWEGGMGYAEIEDLQAKLMATERQLSLLHQELDRGAEFRGGHFSPSGGYDPRRDFYNQGYDAGFDPSFPKPRRRRR